MWLDVFSGLCSGNVSGNGVVAGVGISLQRGQMWCLVL